MRLWQPKERYSKVLRMPMSWHDMFRLGLPSYSEMADRPRKRTFAPWRWHRRAWHDDTPDPDLGISVNAWRRFRAIRYGHFLTAPPIALEVAAETLAAFTMSGHRRARLLADVARRHGLD